METTLHTFAILIVTHPFQVALPSIALYHALRAAAREHAEWRALRRRLVIVGATSRRAPAEIAA